MHDWSHTACRRQSWNSILSGWTLRAQSLVDLLHSQSHWKYSHSKQEAVRDSRCSSKWACLARRHSWHAFSSKHYKNPISMVEKCKGIFWAIPMVKEQQLAFLKTEAVHSSAHFCSLRTWERQRKRMTREEEFKGWQGKHIKTFNETKAEGGRKPCGGA